MNMHGIRIDDHSVRIDDDADFHGVDDDGDNYLKEMTFSENPSGVFNNESRYVACVSYLVWYSQVDRASVRRRLENMRGEIRG